MVTLWPIPALGGRAALPGPPVSAPVITRRTVQRADSDVRAAGAGQNRHTRRGSRGLTAHGAGLQRTEPSDSPEGGPSYAAARHHVHRVARRRRRDANARAAPRRGQRGWHLRRPRRAGERWPLLAPDRRPAAGRGARAVLAACAV